MGQDRADIAEPLKCLSRKMVSPTAGDMTRLKRVCRYLKFRPRLIIRFEPQAMPKQFDVEVDSDFAGDVRTRRSTAGVLVFHGKHLIKSQSSLQSTISLSSGEAEYYSAVTGAAYGLGMQAFLKDWGLEATVRVATDSTAGKGFASRRCLGRVRHVSTRYLWLQEKVAQRQIVVDKIGTEHNRSDALTKPLTAQRLERLMLACGLQFREGRAACQKGTLLSAGA